ncbi:MAG: MFS transporter [Gemmataceae bacterium]
MQKPTRVRYGVLGFCCALSMITYLDRVCFGTVAPYIQSEFGLSETEKGLLFTAFALAYAVFEVPTGWLGDVFGPRKTLIRIVLWWSAFTMLTAAIFPTPVPWVGFSLLVGVRFLFRGGGGGGVPEHRHALHNWFPFATRVRQGDGVDGGPLRRRDHHLHRAGADVRDRHDADGSRGEAPEKTMHWRHIFFIFGALGIAWCLVFSWFRDRPEREGRGERRRRLIHGDAARHSADASACPGGKLLGNANLWILCAMYFCALVRVVFQHHLPARVSA